MTTLLKRSSVRPAHQDVIVQRSRPDEELVIACR